MFIAEKLGKFEHEVLELSPTEYARWLAYFNIRKKAQDRNDKRNKRQAKGKRK